MMTDLPSLQQLVSLSGKRAMITGAAAGIGRAIACRFAEAGADLILVDIDGSALARITKELAGFGVDVSGHRVDLALADEISALWDNLEGQEPDILVNNAGIYPFRHFVDADEEFVHQVMAINYFSISRMCRQMILRRGKRGGVIINLGSIEAVQPFKEDLAHYSVSKASVIALTRALAREYARHGFRVNAILPGGIITPGTKAVAKQVLNFKFDLLKTGYEFSQRLPAGRAGQPDEVARIAVVLASDLSSYVHGAAIPIDGGFLAA